MLALSARDGQARAPPSHFTKDGFVNKAKAGASFFLLSSLLDGKKREEECWNLNKSFSPFTVSGVACVKKSQEV